MNLLKKGFTLIELLVVISIIVLIVGLSAFGMQNSFETSRNAQRKSDIKQYQNALESFANDHNGLYPAYGNSTAVDASSTLCGALGLTAKGVTCSVDPTNKKDSAYLNYQYMSDSTTTDGSPVATKYVLWAKLESSTNYFVVCSNGETGEGGAPTSVTCPL